ncbi:MAG: phosphate ABC transporter permease PstA [Kiritimatiellia bacterium]
MSVPKKHLPLRRYRRPIWGRKLQDALVKAFSIFALILAVGTMLWILTTIFLRGSEALGWGFLTNPSKPYGMPEAGIANALLGTLMITVGATAVAVPLAIAAGIWLAEFGKQGRLAMALRFSANVLMGMPSVIVGLFVYMVLVIPMGGFSGGAGAVALAILMFPVVMRTTEDMLAMVPYTLREAGLALGMTRCRVTLSIICRAAKNGLVTGVLLSIARVSGETAPLLFTALFADTWPTEFFSGPTPNIPVLITEYATNSPFESMHQAGWGAALVITLLVLSVNLLARTFFRERKY